MNSFCDYLSGLMTKNVNVMMFLDIGQPALVANKTAEMPYTRLEGEIKAVGSDYVCLLVNKDCLDVLAKGNMVAIPYSHIVYIIERK